MPPSSKASKAAHELTADGTRLPVPVEQMAQQYAVIVRQQLPADVSGMLVPLELPNAPKKWAIVVNNTDAPVRQRFTIAHELGHLLLHKYSQPHADGRIQVRFRDETSATGSIREEIEANQFAAELLMPEQHVRKWARRLQLDMADPREDEAALRELTRIARRFGVSVQALSFRIANLGIA